MAPVVPDAPVAKERFDLGNMRFYERRFPDKEELVMVKVVRIAEMGAYVSLLEYNQVEGMILMSELSKRRIRSVKKIVRVGRIEVVLVLRVDQDKGYIDLSKKRVSPEEIAKCEERFSKSKRVHQIICHIAQKYHIKVEELNKQITWPLHKKYGHALDAFKDPSFCSVIINDLTLTPEVREALVSDVQLRLSSHTMKMRVRVDVSCYGSAGVDAVQAALLAGKAAAADGKEDADVKVKLIAPPQYFLITACDDKADGERKLQSAVDAIVKCIRTFKSGDAKQQGEFLMIGGEDEKQLGEMEGSNSSDSDSDESEEEDEGMGLVDDNELPEDQVAEDDDEE